MLLRLLLFWATLVALSDDPVSVRVFPTIARVGEDVWLTCRITSDPDNRRLVYGFEDWTSRERQLDGRSPRLWQELFHHPICEAGPAFCIVERADGSTSRAVANFVGPCEP